jgi:ABC-type sugar transport system substrate-binding protein
MKTGNRGRSRVLTFTTVLAALLLLAVGCTTTDAGGADTPTPGDAAQSPEGEEAGGGEAKKNIRIASIRWDPGDIFFNAVQHGQELEAKRLEEAEGVTIEFVVLGGNDTSTQVNAFQTQIDRGVDGILHTPWRGEAMIPLLTQAKEAGIPVVTHNIAVPDAPQVHVAVDNQAAGRLAAEALIEALDELHGEDWASQGGLVIALRCIVTGAFDISRFAGFSEVFDPIFEANPDLVLEVREVGCDGGKARSAVDDLLSRYGNDALRAVWAIDGTSGVGGVIPALDARDMLHPVGEQGHIPLATIDGTGPEMEAIARGFLDHASQQPAIAEGIMSMRVLYHYIQNGLLAEPGQAPVPASPVPTDESWVSEGLGASVQVYPEGTDVWMPLEVVDADRWSGPWYVLPIVEVPEELDPLSDESWPNQMAEQSGT